MLYQFSPALQLITLYILTRKAIKVLYKFYSNHIQIQRLEGANRIQPEVKVIAVGSSGAVSDRH